MMERIETDYGSILIREPESKRWISGDIGIEVMITQERIETITYKDTYTINAKNLTEALRIIEEEEQEADNEQETYNDTEYGICELIKLTVLKEEEIEEEPLEGQLDLFGGVYKAS